jgi:DNA-directed RNA polymerase subunit RPC12/RpoP
MSVEGGDWHCYIHDYRTDNVQSWNKHWTDKKYAKEHVDITNTVCIECGTRFTAEIPAQPILPDGSKGISLRCDECESKVK